MDIKTKKMLLESAKGSGYDKIIKETILGEEEEDREFQLFDALSDYAMNKGIETDDEFDVKVPGLGKMGYHEANQYAHGAGGDSVFTLNGKVLDVNALSDEQFNQIINKLL